ncbi:hypothetical protein KW791_00580 [Candidatus Parcubacteria bacterium]|nr:hypothetical protein [Candidatus Parcubacteria bacterium]
MTQLYDSFAKNMELNPTINVAQPEINIPEIKVPDIYVPEIIIPTINVPTPQVTVNPEINIDLNKVIDALENLKYLSNLPNKPLSVRMSDGNKFVKVIQQLQKATDNLGVVYAGQSGITSDELTIISGRDATDFIWNGTAKLTPKFATIAASSSGNNTIVSAVSTKKIRVIQMDLMADGDVNVKFQSGAGGTDITGLSYLTLNTGLVRGYSPIGWFETAASNLLNLNLSDAVAVGGSLTYVEV